MPSNDRSPTGKNDSPSAPADDGDRWELIWQSTAPLEHGRTSVYVKGQWCVAFKVRSTPDQRPVVEQLRILPQYDFSHDRDSRAMDDRAFWLHEDLRVEEDAEFLADWASPRLPIPDLGVTTGLLRRIPFARIAERELDEFIELVEILDLEPDLWWGEVPPVPGRRGSDRGNVFYAQIAAENLELHRSGVRSPIQTLADRHGYSRNTVKTWLTQARQRGLLETRGKGKPGGTLTEKAKQLLSGQENSDG